MEENKTLPRFKQPYPWTRFLAIVTVPFLLMFYSSLQHTEELRVERNKAVLELEDIRDQEIPAIQDRINRLVRFMARRDRELERERDRLLDGNKYVVIPKEVD